MIMTRWLWLLWGAMVLSMVIKWQIETYMMVALIILPILIVLMDLHEEIATLKEENRHQRKFVLDRYNLLQERLKEMTAHIEKRMVVDFAELAKDNIRRNDRAEIQLTQRLEQDKKDAEKRDLMNLQESLDDDDDTGTYLDEDNSSKPDDTEDYTDI